MSDNFPCRQMWRTELGFFVIAVGMLIIGCPNPTMDSAKSGNASLSGITLSSGTLSPVFAAGTTAYTASVANTVTSVTVTGVKADANDSVSAPVTLSNLIVGVEQTATITVTAEDGTTTRSYTVAVSRMPSSLAVLIGLTLSSGTLNPSFGVFTTAYTAVVANSVSTITITGTTLPGASISYSPAQTSSLNVGVNTITLTVTAQDGTTTMSYVVAVNRTAPYDMIPVAGGTFSNGTGDVTVSAFSISKYEITQAQYMMVAQDLPGYMTNQGINPSLFLGDTNRPVEQVNWYNALVFCNALSIKEGLTPVYTIAGQTVPGGWGTPPLGGVGPNNANYDSAIMNMSANGYRLPTEAEWEFAARGGTSTAGYTYAGSNTIDDVAWYSGNSGGTHRVGGKTANALGLFDMTGNVAELCWDWYGTYPSVPQTDPVGPSSGLDRTMRGGGYSDVAADSTVSHRSLVAAYSRYSGIGFRVVRRP